MNIRKLIREQIGKILNEENPISAPVITGMEILNHFPFNKLPETRDDVNWSERGVSGWGDVQVPSLDGSGLQQILAKDDIIGMKPWAHPKTGHVLQDAGYIENFKKAFGEEPMFVLSPSAPWYGKITVINEPYIKRKELHDKAVQSFGTEGD